MEAVHVAIYGANGFGREVLQVLLRKGANLENIVFVDDDETLNGKNIDGVFVRNFEYASENNFEFVIAIANGEIRKIMADKLTSKKLKIFDVISASSISSSLANIDNGVILSDFVTITANCKIGKFFHANIYSYVAHDCVIGDFVTFAPSVSCNGRVHIEDHAYIGTGAILRQGSHDRPLTIGRGAVVGMGAVVTKDVPAGVTVVGNPARILEKQN
jgi:sugar O-acyltransferase (sialic acid O-acetyltransferase NeuD family)